MFSESISFLNAFRNSFHKEKIALLKKFSLTLISKETVAFINLKPRIL